MRAPSTNVRGITDWYVGLAQWQRFLIAGLVLIGAVVLGGMFGYMAAWELAFYVPEEAERDLLVVVSVFALVLSVALIALRGLGLSRFALSWVLVAAASTYLWTSGTFDADRRQQAHADTFGVLTVEGYEDAGAITSARLTVDGSLAILDVDSTPGTHPLFFVVAPTRPNECAEYGNLHTQGVYACTAPASIRFKDAVSYSWSAPAMQSVGVSIATAEYADEVGGVPVRAAPVDVTFETYTPDDDRVFERPLLGSAAVDQWTVHFAASSQPVASDHWSAVLEYRLPRGVALLSLARDFSLIVLGGAVSLFLLPRGAPAAASGLSLPRGAHVDTASEVPTGGSAPTRNTRMPNPRPRSGMTAAILGSVLTLLTLTALRAIRPGRR